MILASDNPMRPVFLSILIFEVIIFGLAVPVMILVSGVPSGVAAGFGGGAALLALVGSGLMRRPVGYVVGWVTQLVGVLLLTGIVGAVSLVERSVVEKQDEGAVAAPQERELTHV